MIHLVVSVGLSALTGFLENMLCTTSMVQSYIVHHQPELCTNDLHCAPCAQEGNTFFSHVGFLTNIGPPCAPWCTTQASGAQRSSHKPKWTDGQMLPNVLSPCYTVEIFRLEKYGIFIKTICNLVIGGKNSRHHS